MPRLRIRNCPCAVGYQLCQKRSGPQADPGCAARCRRHYVPVFVSTRNAQRPGASFRQAFQTTLKDPEFVAEAKKGNFELDPVAGEELEKIVNGFLKTDAATVTRLRDLLK